MTKRLIDGFPTSFSDSLPCFLADNVAAFMAQLGTLEYRKDIPNVRPPFKVMWVEARWPDSIKTNFGFICLEQTREELEKQEVLRESNLEEILKSDYNFFLYISVYVEKTVLYQLILPFDEDGTPNFDICRPLFHQDYHKLDEEDKQFGYGLVAIPLLTICFCNCKNIIQEVKQSPKVLQKINKDRKNPKPEIKWHVLKIDRIKKILNTEGELQSKGIKHALHICRGHFKTFTKERPLLGKHVGTFWWSQQVRGSSEHGIVHKDYEV